MSNRKDDDELSFEGIALIGVVVFFVGLFILLFAMLFNSPLTLPE